jgi:uncharacterized protein (DUF1810 family)
MSDLDRYLEAQEKDYEKALTEIQNGKKENHWIYYIFPQIKGLEKTEISNKYGIKNIEEAIEFLKNEKLRKNLIEITQVLLDKKEGTDIKDIMGFPDNLKLKSSMTLFKVAEEESKINCNEIFKKILDKYYEGEEDAMTLVILQKQKYQKEHGEESVEEDNIEKDKKDMDDIIKEYQNQNIDLGSSVNIETKLNENKLKLNAENNHENNETTNDNENNKNEDREPNYTNLISSVISPRDVDNDFDNFEREKEANEKENCCKVCNIM